MERELEPKSPSIRRNSYLEEKELLLMKFQGIFKHNIKEYSQVMPKHKNKKNYAK